MPEESDARLRQNPADQSRHQTQLVILHLDEIHLLVDAADDVGEVTVAASVSAPFTDLDVEVVREVRGQSMLLEKP